MTKHRVGFMQCGCSLDHFRGLDAQLLGNDLLRGGSGPAFQFPLERLASWVHVAPVDDAEPEEAADTWQVTLGSSNLIRGQAMLRGRPTAVDGGRVEFEHTALGPISFVMEDVKRIDHVRRAKRRSFVFDEWETKPMPEPVITDDSGESGGR